MSAEPAELAVVFRGPKALCREYSLVLEARGIEHEVQAPGLPDAGGSWIVTVPSALAHRAYDELTRYSAERSVPRSMSVPLPPFPGAKVGPQVLWRAVSDVRRNGFGETHNKRIDEGASISGAVRGPADDVVGALTVSIPIGRYTAGVRAAAIETILGERP